jgi:hypothetical protein
MKSKSKVLLVVLTAIFVCSTFSVTFAEAQPVEVWNVTWGGPGDDEGRAVATVGDCVYLAGTIDGVDAFLNKYDSGGNIIWNVTWVMSPLSVEYSDVVAMTAIKGSVYLAGITASSNNSDSDAFLNRYDTDGNRLWNITYGGSGSFMGYATAATEDSVFLAGEIISNGSEYHAFVNKYGSDGNLIWNLTWSGPGTYFASAMTTANGGVYVAGREGHKAFLHKYNSTTGTLIWNITSLGLWAIASGDKGVYSVGYTIPGAGLNKYNSTDGSLIWNITCSEISQGWSTAASGDSVYLAGPNESYGEVPCCNTGLNKYNSTDGSLIWNITWGKAGWVNGRAVATAGDSVYLAGTTKNSSDANGSAFLVKFTDLTPTPTVTPVPTSTPTPTPAATTPIEAPTVPPAAPPGFEAVFAVAGLLAVAFLVWIKRRN